MCAEQDIGDRLAYPEPEIRRLNLESVVLRFIKWGISPLDFNFFHSPKKNLIHRAIDQLKVFGAISEEMKVTADGNKMAELPVSIRSSRLLIEAMKGSDRVLDSSLKMIAILETKGIVSKEFMGEKCYTGDFRSDILNQLYLWNSEKQNRQIISRKKFQMAKEIYRELKNRIRIGRLKVAAVSDDINMLFRAILSTFVDFVYKKIGKTYAKNEEERQLDRNSILFESLPEMIVGIPFDLVLDLENQKTGEKEKKYLPLITFASEISTKILEDIKPFSYRKEREIKIENDIICVQNKIYFGGKVLTSYVTPPEWNNTEEMRTVLRLVYEWFFKYQKRYKIKEKGERIKKYFPEIKKIVGKELKPYDFYWENFLRAEIKNHLKNENLDLFFKFHKGFEIVTLKNLLPFRFIKELKRIKWPGHIEIGGKTLDISYINSKPFLEIDISFIEKINRQDLLLPTGEKAGLIFNNRKYQDWEYAVYTFNRWKKREIFDRKWRDKKRILNIEDLKNIPFPQPFEGGSGKEKEKFEYYAVPQIKGNEVFLIHFMDKDKAQAYYDSIRTELDSVVREFKKKKLEDIFKQKGWKVK